MMMFEFLHFGCAWGVKDVTCVYCSTMFHVIVDPSVVFLTLFLQSLWHLTAFFFFFYDVNLSIFVYSHMAERITSVVHNYAKRSIIVFNNFIFIFSDKAC
uniref:Uncharacterized protein n=1 Tax=Cacopsylla melanoneura TaxID=428564 RepID=A0A8D8XRU4_9HEMI